MVLILFKFMINVAFVVCCRMAYFYFGKMSPKNKLSFCAKLYEIAAKLMRIQKCVYAYVSSLLCSMSRILLVKWCHLTPAINHTQYIRVHTRARTPKIRSFHFIYERMYNSIDATFSINRSETNEKFIKHIVQGVSGLRVDISTTHTLGLEDRKNGRPIWEMCPYTLLLL